MSLKSTLEVASAKLSKTNDTSSSSSSSNITGPSFLEVFTVSQTTPQSAPSTPTGNPLDRLAIPGRRAELDTLVGLVIGALRGQASGRVYVSGRPGTGKSAMVSALVSYLRHHLAEHRPAVPVAVIRDLRIVKVNCVRVTSPRQLLDQLAALLNSTGGGGSASVAGPSGGQAASSSASDALTAASTFSAASSPPVVLFLDEIDHLSTESLYTVFEWTLLPRARLAVVGIANAFDLIERAMPRLRAKNCEPERMVILPYTRAQLEEVMRHHVRQNGAYGPLRTEAFNRWAKSHSGGPLPPPHGPLAEAEPDLLSPAGALQVSLCASKAAAHGDTRLGLSLLLEAATSLVTQQQQQQLQQQQQPSGEGASALAAGDGPSSIASAGQWQDAAGASDPGPNAAPAPAAPPPPVQGSIFAAAAAARAASLGGGAPAPGTLFPSRPASAGAVGLGADSRPSIFAGRPSTAPAAGPGIAAGGGAGSLLASLPAHQRTVIQSIRDLFEQAALARLAREEEALRAAGPGGSNPGGPLPAGTAPLGLPFSIPPSLRNVFDRYSWRCQHPGAATTGPGTSSSSSSGSRVAGPPQVALTPVSPATFMDILDQLLGRELIRVLSPPVSGPGGAAANDGAAGSLIDGGLAAIFSGNVGAGFAGGGGSRRTSRLGAADIWECRVTLTGSFASSLAGDGL
ncbi:hypothetical protein H696_06188 [Fonticula alba]|uniref:AAA+ ATPase domain-containing protein n=1 Tax=Fonticula alba TaxID=691883 RepID=A0A058YZU2_FONAL|nr:hypothetical protein H696_06188 [Fonticula alba]KCV67396.1 hypothetical protein H696_06188 [Fonticula alba]|eukprot:XP_009498207.1 hypothetical protein H696_06188 [Fonticula alba]